uniref:Alpha-carbonic anhydrase domain-containing protein n=1 Tax=Acanthochromis polyacanthus TaxID=80966 RepID=A0A3Q1GHA7_9TELE
MDFSYRTTSCNGVLYLSKTPEYFASLTFIENSPSKWKDISGSFCGDKRQSPLNIVTSHVVTDSKLNNFTFVNFSSEHAIKSIVNTGHTGTQTKTSTLSGGGLNGTYSTIQFHFHWGDTEHHPGSEHTIDDHRYPMEVQHLSLKKGLAVEQAIEKSDGIAVLGFFINVCPTTFTAQTHVDLTKFYRYMGSLTTPMCNEAVAWTVFQEPINIHKDLSTAAPAESITFPLNYTCDQPNQSKLLRNGQEACFVCVLFTSG